MGIIIISGREAKDAITFYAPKIPLEIGYKRNNRSERERESPGVGFKGREVCGESGKTYGDDVITCDDQMEPPPLM